MSHHVFVYGTLKKGFQYHHLIENSTFNGTAKTKEKYAMYQNDYPCVVKNEAVSFIYGEVYSVEDSTLEKLDLLEGHPDSYCREQVQVMLDLDSLIMSAWLYFNPDNSGTLVQTGEYIPQYYNQS